MKNWHYADIPEEVWKVLVTASVFVLGYGTVFCLAAHAHIECCICGIQEVCDLFCCLSYLASMSLRFMCLMFNIFFVNFGVLAFSAVLV